MTPQWSVTSLLAKLITYCCRFTSIDNKKICLQHVVNSPLTLTLFSHIKSMLISFFFSKRVMMTLIYWIWLTMKHSSTCFYNVWIAVHSCTSVIMCKQGKSEGFDSCDRPSNLKLDSNRQFFRLCDREIWWMTLQNNRAPLLCYFKLCASFRTHWWIQTWVTFRKRSIRVKIDNFLSCVT